MKRFCVFLALMALGSSAHASESFSFVVAGHRIRIEAPRHCRSASCVSVSIPGVYRSNRSRDHDDEVAASPAPAPAPANPPTRAAAPVVPAAAASPPPVQPVAAVPPSPAPPLQAPPTAPAPQLASSTAKIVVLPPPVVSTTQTIAPPPPKAEPVKTIEPPPIVMPKPVPVPAPQIAKVSQETEDEPADTPQGDWQTEGNKGTVRIERCGEAMCGYLLNLASNAQGSTKGDTILINMKPKWDAKPDTRSDATWSGNIYSRSSGHTYYAKMTMKGINTLRVEACALGRFFCSGNDWTRVENASKLMTSRETPPRPPS